jgi:hypothetical protein
MELGLSPGVTNKEQSIHYDGTQQAKRPERSHDLQVKVWATFCREVVPYPDSPLACTEDGKVLSTKLESATLSKGEKGRRKKGHALIPTPMVAC